MFNGFYTFANSPFGEQLRQETANAAVEAEKTARLFEEKVTVGKLTFTLLKLEVTGKRAGEGETARQVKARA